MNRKIVGVTVGTPMNPERIAEKFGAGAALPKVTEEDNGKVLKVQSGQWSAEENNAEKFGGQSPDYYANKTEIPTKVSELENDKGYITEHQSLDDYAKKTDIPTIPTKVSAFENDTGYITQHQDLSDYAKKSEIPTVPTKVSAFENDTGYLTEHQDLSEYAKATDIPTKVSQLTNDEGYLTEHQSLDNYYTKPEVTEELNKKQDALDKYVESVNGYSGEVMLSASDVNALPDTTVIPTVPNVVSAFTNDADYASRTYVSEVAAGKCKAYTFETATELDEWLKVTDNTTELNNGDVFYIREVGVPDYWWDKETQSKQILETTKVDLTGYAKSGDIPLNVSQLTNDANYITESKVDTKLGSKQDKLTEYVSSVNGKSGAVSLNCNDVGAMPADTSIPTALSQLSQDATHRIVTDTEKATWNAKSNFSGSYNDLTNKPTIPSAYSHPSTHPVSMITGLATVATSGSYNDLSNKPTIPTVPTKLSQFNNDKEFLTKTEVQTLITALENKIASEYLGGYKWRVGTSSDSGKAGYVTVKKG